MNVAGDAPEEARVTFTGFFHDSGRQLTRLAYLLVGNLGDAEDVTQDVLEELYRRWADVRPDTAMAYARTAVVNRSRSLLRRRAVARRFAPRLAPPEQAGPAPIEDGWLWELVQTLPRRQREVVVLRYWCDLGEVEIARVLSVSAGTVKSSAHRAHARLAAALEEHNSTVTEDQKGAR
ncbi:sigma-70 family RNA polymerase sigma factor [Actinoplanes sp. NPDC049118]|uniref:sigma-70 family RNA polymerase sigma factor n=1 Tax=Actinoplanes sp. NPDC049118 TaxID=3155769 RepID=UPI0033F5A33F